MDTRKSLFKIQKEYTELLDLAVNPETGEILEEYLEEVEKLNSSKGEKIQNYVRYIQYLKNQESAYKAEKRRISMLNDGRKNLIARLQDGILSQMEIDKTDRYEFDMVKVTRGKGQYSLLLSPEKEKEMSSDMVKAELELSNFKEILQSDKKLLKASLKMTYSNWETNVDPNKDDLEEWIDGAKLTRKPSILIR